jgi:hypothetical protein
LRSRGMIRMRMPAIRATMAGICVAVMTIAVSPACWGIGSRARNLAAHRVPE